MNQRIARHAATLVCLVLGCNQQSSQPVAESPTTQTAQPPRQVTLQATSSQSESPAMVTPPADVVSTFLTALREGDERTTSALLTNKAREETSKRNLTVRPPGAPSAVFEIGKVEYIGPQNDGAHVTSRWTEDDEQGNRITYDVVWAMRRQSDGWRIAGLAANLTAEESPVFLNFEDPDDMIAKQRRAEQIAAEYQRNPSVQQARQPSQGSPAFR